MLVFVLSGCGGAAPSGTTDQAGGGAATQPAGGTQATTAPAQEGATLPAAGAAEGGAEVTFWARDSARVLVDPLIEEFNKSHNFKIKPTFIPADQFVQKFSTAMAGGQGPDLIAVDLIYMPAYSAAEQMTDISDFAKALPFYDKLIPSHMRLGTYNGKIYSVPFNAEGSVLVYNKNLFKQAGLDPEKPPTNWTEMEEYAKKITALGNGTSGFYFSGACAGCNAFTVLPYVWASGGDVLSEDGKQATLTNPSVKATLEFLRRMWEGKQIPETAKVDTGTEFLNAFTTGKIGMSGTGAFAIATLKSKHPNVDFGVAPLPGQKGGSASFAGGDTIAIPAGSKRVNEAQEFLTWFLSEDVQVNIIAKNGGLPLRLDLVENEHSKKDPRYVTVARAMFEQGRTPYVLPYNEIFNDPNGPWLAMLQKAIFDGQIDPAIGEAQQRFTEILSQQQ